MELICGNCLKEIREIDENYFNIAKKNREFRKTLCKEKRSDKE